MRFLINLIIKAVNILYSYNDSIKNSYRFQLIYTLWINRVLSEFGLGSTIGKNTFIKGGEFIKIGNYTSIGKNSIITAWSSNNKISPLIQIGDKCCIGEYCHITSANKIIINDGVLTGRWVTITDNSHGFIDYDNMKIEPIKRELSSKGPIIIEKNVWIGDKVTILPNVIIGEGSIVGANSVVTKSVSPYSVVGGNPAKILKELIKNE